MNKKVIKRALAMGMSFVVLSAGLTGMMNVSAAKKLSISTKKLTLTVGQKKTIKANMTVKFSISGKKIVSLKNVKKKQCSVVAKKQGSCVVKVKAGKQVKKITVNVKKKTPTPTKTPLTPNPVAENPTVNPTITPTINPSEIPVETEDVKPENTPVATEDVKPGHTPVATEDVKPEHTPAATEDVIPEHTPAATADVSPENTPVATENVKPENTPAATENVKPEYTPVATENVTPEKTPTATEDVKVTEAPTTTPVITPTSSPSFTPAPTKVPEIVSMERTVNRFGFEMFDQLQEGENMMISPYSIMMALTLLDNAADGETKNQIEQVLGIADLEQWNEEFSKYYKNNMNYEDDFYSMILHSTNSIWKNDQYFSFDSKIQKEYMDKMTALYGTEIESMDFANSNPKEQINQWVEKNTKGMLKNFIQDPITPDVQTVLVNAVYFSGQWMNEFEKESTYQETFYGKKGETSVDMMHKYMAGYRYVEQDGLAVVEIPFKGENHIVMDVVLASEKNASTVTEFQKLSEQEKENLFQNVSKSKYQKLDISLPKFKMTYGSKSIVEQLKKMGITQVFDQGTAQLPALKGDNLENVYADEIMHQTVIEVAERGVKAAAATDVILKENAAPPEDTIDFCVNKPFVYVIRDASTNMIYFMGQVEDITESELLQ